MAVRNAQKATETEEKEKAVNTTHKEQIEKIKADLQNK